jgi:hypothetical protein
VLVYVVRRPLFRWPIVGMAPLDAPAVYRGCERVLALAAR